MLYQLSNKYYIRVAPMKYTEVKLIVKNNDVVISITNNRMIADRNTVFTEINFQKEKEKIKASLLEETKDTSNVNNISVRSSKYRKRA